MIATPKAAALVKGAAPAKPVLVKVEVVRPFCVAGVRLEVGATLEVSETLARELQVNGKAVPHVEKPAAKPAPSVEKQKPTSKGP